MKLSPEISFWNNTHIVKATMEVFGQLNTTPAKIPRGWPYQPQHVLLHSDLRTSGIRWSGFYNSFNWAHLLISDVIFNWLEILNFKQIGSPSFNLHSTSMSSMQGGRGKRARLEPRGSGPGLWQGLKSLNISLVHPQSSFHLEKCHENKGKKFWTLYNILTAS